MSAVQADLQTAQMIAREAQKARTDAEARRNAAERKIKDLQANVSPSEHRPSQPLTFLYADRRLSFNQRYWICHPTE